MTRATKQRPVVVIGGANMDLTGQAHSPLTAGDSTPGAVHATAGGVGRNIAEALARLACPTQLITALGDDGFAEDIARQTSAAGVDLRATLRVPEQRSSTYLSVLEPTGEMRAAISDMALVGALTPAVLEERRRDLDKAQAWVIDANLSEEALGFLFAIADPACPIYAEPVSATKALRLQPYLAQIAMLKPNRLEAAALSGLSPDQPPETLAVALLECGIDRVVISDGAEGIWGQDAGGTAHHQPAFAGPIRSVTGAGDTLMAALVDATLAGVPLPDALARAQAAASLSLQSARAIHPGLCQAAVQAELEREP
ncbi:MAG: PfkB family carbohydrate kinase [Pseudomonadota bacterium]|nr:PfkB family carbohydrate kinase [Pseudomonadota bacterium]